MNDYQRIVIRLLLRILEKLCLKWSATGEDETLIEEAKDKGGGYGHR